VAAVDAAITQARAEALKPTLIICKTTIGKGSPNRAGSRQRRMARRWRRRIKLTARPWAGRTSLFVIPEAAYAAWDGKRAGEASEAQVDPGLRRLQGRAPAPSGHRAGARMSGDLPAASPKPPVDRAPPWPPTAPPRRGSSRKASQIALEAFTAALPELSGTDRPT